jgi:signal transduction histidine kinase
LQVVREKMANVVHRKFRATVAGGNLSTDNDFARLVSLACHDLRTPLATVHGFAKTLIRLGDLDEQPARYVEMIDAASSQLAELLDELGLVARIEAGRYEPALRPVETEALARFAAEQLGEDRVGISGAGGVVSGDPPALERAVSALAQAALRHGGLERVEVTAEEDGVTVEPITKSSAPVVLGEDLRDLGAAAAVRLVHALGGSVEADGEALRVRLPRN